MWGAIFTANVISGYGGESLHRALEKMRDNRIGRLPIVARDEPGKLVGILCKMRHTQGIRH